VLHIFCSYDGVYTSCVMATFRNSRPDSSLKVLRVEKLTAEMRLLQDGADERRNASE
jgi:hypothetical protein